MKEQNYNYSGARDASINERERRHRQLARKLAAEGMVLLKNEGLLPLCPSTPLALFGGGAAKTAKGGIGSGDVNNRENISIYQGLKAAKASIVNESWLTDYETRYQAARETWKATVLAEAKHVENPFDAYAANPFVLPEGREITTEDIKNADVAVYVISRISGEGKDRRREEGDYYLSRKEREDLLFLSQMNLPTVLVLNTGGPVELTDLLEKQNTVRAILNISQPGQEGGHAAADVLFGRVTPGGRLTATWARRYEDYPCAESYSYLNGNLEKEEYREGIYVGYRYFDSFGVQPLFPFGYGLSYTSFEITYDGLSVKKDGVEISVNVKNTGDRYPGREVVQVYATLPQTGNAREYQRLAGFAKTAVLQPQETQPLTIFIRQKQLAIFSEQTQTWTVPEGMLGLWIGNHSRSLKPVAALLVKRNTVLEKTDVICPQKITFTEYKEPGTAQKRAADLCRMVTEQLIPQFTFVPEAEKKRKTVTPKAIRQPVTEFIPLLYGNITQGASTLGSSGIRVPGSAGETTEAMEEKYGIASLIMADGPAGLRLRQSYEVDSQSGAVYGVGVLGSLENGFLEPLVPHKNAVTYYQYCTAFPVGTALAQSWDTQLLKEFGEAIAAEMQEFHINLWLAPGMNIQRNPLCGRNFEYYSEDPLLSGAIGAAVTAGVQSKKGCGVTIKHFACNNQEDNRMSVNVCVSEKALREIYLRGFEIAVKESAPAAVMSSYNLINGVHAANSRELCTTVLREEWGFNGVVMSDWNTTCPQDGSIPWRCAASGNDIIMPGNPNDAQNISRAYEKGLLSEQDIRICAGRIIALVNRLTK